MMGSVRAFLLGTTAASGVGGGAGGIRADFSRTYAIILPVPDAVRADFSRTYVVIGA